MVVDEANRVNVPTIEDGDWLTDFLADDYDVMDEGADVQVNPPSPRVAVDALDSMGAIPFPSNFRHRMISSWILMKIWEKRGTV